MDVPDRVGQPLPHVLPLVAVEKLIVLVNIARNYIEVEPLGSLRLAIHEQRQALGTGVAQPLLDGQAVTFRLRNLLALLVEEELVVEPIRGDASERTTDL